MHLFTNKYIIILGMNKLINNDIDDLKLYYSSWDLNYEEALIL